MGKTWLEPGPCHPLFLFTFIYLMMNGIMVLYFYSNFAFWFSVSINKVILCIHFRGLLKHWILKLSAGLQEKRGTCVLCSPPYNMYVLITHTLNNLSEFFLPGPCTAQKYVVLNNLFILFKFLGPNLRYGMVESLWFWIYIFSCILFGHQYTTLGPEPRSAWMCWLKCKYWLYSFELLCQLKV